jgi:hypothetical protein
MTRCSLGDVVSTNADISRLKKDFNYQPATSIKNRNQHLLSVIYQFYGVSLTNFENQKQVTSSNNSNTKAYEQLKIFISSSFYFIYNRLIHCVCFLSFQ